MLHSGARGSHVGGEEIVSGKQKRNGSTPAGLAEEGGQSTRGGKERGIDAGIATGEKEDTMDVCRT